MLGAPLHFWLTLKFPCATNAVAVFDVAVPTGVAVAWQTTVVGTVAVQTCGTADVREKVTNGGVHEVVCTGVACVEMVFTEAAVGAAAAGARVTDGPPWAVTCA